MYGILYIYKLAVIPLPLVFRSQPFGCKPRGQITPSYPWARGPNDPWPNPACRITIPRLSF